MKGTPVAVEKVLERGQLITLNFVSKARGIRSPPVNFAYPDPTTGSLRRYTVGVAV